MKILALDLATTTGYCFGDIGQTPKAGAISLASSKEIKEFGRKRLDRRQDPRPIRLYKFLGDLCYGVLKAPDVLIFEDVEFLSYQKQCQLWSALRTSVWLFAHFHGIHVIDCLGVSKLKKFATGYGAADKAAMALALYKKYPEFVTQALDDNGVDAAHLWHYAKETFSRM